MSYYSFLLSANYFHKVIKEFHNSFFIFILCIFISVNHQHQQYITPWHSQLNSCSICISLRRNIKLCLTAFQIVHFYLHRLQLEHITHRTEYILFDRLKVSRANVFSGIYFSFIFEHYWFKFRLPLFPNDFLNSKTSFLQKIQPNARYD